MLRSKFAKAFMFTMCITLLSSGAAMAKTGEAGAVSAQVQPADSEGELLQKQQEIDSYVFEEHREEIAAKGFTVTHTGPMDGYVEIGITPYSEENVNYLYDIFGKDDVKVVEGIQAATMEITTTSANDDESLAAVTTVNDNAEAARKESAAPNTLLYSLIGIGVLGGTALVVKKAAAKR